jgi:prophage regulatory protein
MRLLRTREVLRITGLSRMTIHRLEKRGDFPQRRRIGRQAVAWIDAEIDDWIASRPFGCGATAHPRNQRAASQAASGLAP